MSKSITPPNKQFIKRIIKHYLKYDKENPFIFISAMLAFLGIAAGVMVLMLAMGIMNGTQKEFVKKLFVMNYPLTVLPLEEKAIDDALIDNKSSLKMMEQYKAHYFTVLMETRKVR